MPENPGVRWTSGGDARSSVLLVTKWRDDSGATRVRLLAADRPDAHELTTDVAGALTWVTHWLGGPPADRS